MQPPFFNKKNWHCFCAIFLIFAWFSVNIYAWISDTNHAKSKGTNVILILSIGAKGEIKLFAN